VSVLWSSGDVVIRREVVNDGRCWLELPVVVVRDDDELLATYIAPGTPFTFQPGLWPGATGRHPWHGRDAWEGNGVLNAPAAGRGLRGLGLLVR
jgi:hypothetical protein